MPALVCENQAAAEKYEAEVAERVWEAHADAGCFVEGRWAYASLDPRASSARLSVKFDGEVLYQEGRERQLGIVLGAVAGHPCIQDADVLLYAPDGTRKFVNMLGGILGIEVAQTERPPRPTSRYDYVFSSPEDEEKAHAAVRPRIVEDVVSTLGSVDGVHRLLLPGQRVHVVAQLLRGVVDPAYQHGLAEHYLTRRDMPLGMTAPEFHAKFGFWPVTNGRK